MYTPRQHVLIDAALEAGLDIRIERPWIGRQRYIFMNSCGRKVEMIGMRAAEQFIECYVQYKDLIDMLRDTDIDAFKERLP